MECREIFAFYDTWKWPKSVDFFCHLAATAQTDTQTLKETLRIIDSTGHEIGWVQSLEL